MTLTQALASLIQHEKIAHCEIDKAGRYRLVNHAWLASYGYDREEQVIGRHYKTTIPEEDLAAANQYFARLTKGEPIVSGTLSKLDKKGTVGYFTFTAAPIWDNQHVMGFSAIQIDTTEQYQIEKEKQKLAQLESLILQSFDDVIYRIRVFPRFEIEYLSPSVERIIGYTPEELSTDPEMVLGLIHPADRQRMQAALADDGIKMPQPVLLRWLHKKGNPVWLEHRYKARYSDERKLIGFDGITRNVTELMNTRQELYHKNNQLQKLSRKLQISGERERDQIAETLHERVSQDLVVAKMNAQLLRENKDQDRSDKLLDQTIELLDSAFSQLRSTVLPLRPPLLKELGLVPAIEQLIGDISRTDRAELELQVRGESFRFGSVKENAIYCCIHEALTNAWQHSGASKIRVTICFGGETVSVRVTDNGRGFDRSPQDYSTTGLIGTRERLAPLGGILHIRTKRNWGTTLIFRIPVTRSDIV